MIDDQQSPKTFLTSFVLEQIAAQPIEQQLRLYRCMAVETLDPRLARECRLLATEIEKLMSDAKQMHLNFCNRNR